MRAAGALIACALAVAPVMQARAQPSSAQHDFDWEFGTWTTTVRVLRNPLSGQPPEWATYEGTSIVKPLLDGRANFVELSVVGPAGKIEGGSLRLFNPQSRQWSLNFASLRDGQLTAPVFGSFASPGQGTFYGAEMIEGRAIIVRFIVTVKAANEAAFEQAYSIDGGATWEVNWVATDKRP